MLEISAMINKGLNEKDLIILKFTDKETKTKLNWKHSREFEFDGHMYDIVEQGREGNSFWYKCYRDHKETRLYKEKEKLIAKALGNDPFQKKQNEKIRNFFKTVFQLDDFIKKDVIFNPSIIHYSLFTIHYSLFLPSPPTPPPEIL